MALSAFAFRRLLCVPALALLCMHAVVAAPLHRDASQVNWSQFGFDASHTGYNPYETVLNSGNVGAVQQVWSASTGKFNDVGNVVEADGIVYAPTFSGLLFALDATTGNVRWSFNTGPKHFTTAGSAPAIDPSVGADGLVFTVCADASEDQGICAVRGDTGKLVWQYTFPGQHPIAASPPTVAYHMVYYEACTTSCSYVALSEASGKVVWTLAEPLGSCEGNGNAPPTAANFSVYIGLACPGQTGSVCALTATAGAVEWCVPENGQPAGVAVMRAQAFWTLEPYAGASSFIDVAIGGSRSGTVLWNEPFGNDLYHAAPAIDGHEFFAVIFGALWKFTAGGSPVWSTGESARFWPSLANGVVYYACIEPKASFCARDAVGQSNIIWEGGRPHAGDVPIVVNGTIYGACASTMVCAWALPGRRRR